MTPDRVAEALAALEAAEEGATPAPWDPAWFGMDLVGDNSHCAADAEFIARWRNAAPAWLKLAAAANNILDERRECWHPELAAALDELAKAVLGP